MFKANGTHKSVNIFGNNVSLCKKIAVIMYKDLYNIDVKIKDIILDDIVIMNQ